MKFIALILSLAFVARATLASWERFDDAGRRMARGGVFDPAALTAASWQYPIGTRLLVTDAHNGSRVTVTITDRTSRRFDKRIDLSPAAFAQLNGLELGVCDVTLVKLEK